MMNKKGAAAVSAALAAALTTNAAVAADSNANRLEEVMVTASRVEKPLSTIPNTVTVINTAELEEQLAINNDISTVLGNLIPSFSPSRQKMTNAGESLRGRKPLYMIDGVPQSSPLREGGRDGHIIDPAVLARIEVLHGANAIHGLGASGGIINLITKKPTETFQQSVRVDGTFQTEDVGESGDYGALLQRLEPLRECGCAGEPRAARFGHLVRRQRRCHRLRQHAGRHDGLAHAQRVPEDRLRLGASAPRAHLQSLRHQGQQRLDLRARATSPRESPSSAIRGQIAGEGARNKVTNLAVSYTNDAFFGHSLRAQAVQPGSGIHLRRRSRRRIATFQDPAFGPNLIDQSQNNSEKLGLKLTLAKDQLAGLPLNLVYGFDVLVDETWQSLIQTGRSWVPKSRSENYAPFLQAEFTGIDSLTVTARRTSREIQAEGRRLHHAGLLRQPVRAQAASRSSRRRCTTSAPPIA